MKCGMRQVSFKSSANYKQVDILPTMPGEAHKGKREKLRRASSLVQQKLNGKHSRRYLIQLVNANFGEGDWLLTLNYDPEFLPETFEEAEHQCCLFMDRLRAACKRAGEDAPKYIFVTEGGTEEQETAGEVHRYHHHLFLACRLDAREIAACWESGRGKKRRKMGYVDFKIAHPKEGSLEEWAMYCVKAKRYKRKWHQSLMLKKPVITVNDSRWSRRSVERIVQCGEALNPRYWEKQFPGWRCRNCQVEYNEYWKSHYIRLEFYRDREVKRWKTENARATGAGTGKSGAMKNAGRIGNTVP